MKEQKIVITCDGENVGIGLDELDETATIEELLIMHSCFTSMLIRELVARGMRSSEAIKGIKCSDKDAIEMYMQMHLHDILENGEKLN